MSAFLVCSRSETRAWTIDSWKDDDAEAERIAHQLVTKPYMAEVAAVFEVGGTDPLPTFTLVFQATR